MKEYNWKRPWDAKGMSVNKAVKTLNKIGKEFGKITPQTIVEHSKDEKSPLHSLFEWDNEKAGDKWRLQEARLLINNIEITIISDGESREIGAYEIVKVEDERQYKNIEVLSQSEIEYVKESALKLLQQASSKLSMYKQYEQIVFDVNTTIKKLKVLETVS